jgi:putative ABC transport system permease protein
MNWLKQIFSRRRIYGDFSEEIREHLEEKIEELVASGMPRKEAELAARREFGNVTLAEEDGREVWRWAALENFFGDLRFGVRMLRKSLGFTLVAVTAMALGIGFSATIFSVFYNGVLHPFPYKDADRLTTIGVRDPKNPTQGFRDMFHLDEVRAFREHNHSFDDIVSYSNWDVNYTHNGVTEPVHGCMMTPNAMEFWGVAPLMGRGLMEEDSKAGAPPVVLLNYQYWKKTFQEDASIIGKTMILHAEARTVIGVMPPRFMLYGAGVYIPMNWNRPEPTREESMEGGTPMYYFTTGKLRPGVSLAAAGAEMQSIAQPLVALHREDYPENFQMTARSMSDIIVGDFKQTLILLIVAVVLLLLISSSNVASLLLTHHSARAREISLRAALGASRGRLIRQLFVESLILGAMGCAAGTFLAYVGNRVLKLVPGIEVPGEADITLNLPVLYFAIALSLLTTLLFGLSPTLFAMRRDLRTNLQTTGLNVNASRSGARVRAGLVVGQVGLSMLLLVFAGLMIRSFLAMTSVDLGVHTQNLFIGRIHFPPKQYDSAESKRQYIEKVLQRVSAIPGVTNAMVTLGAPVMFCPGLDDVTIPGKPHDKKWNTCFEAVSEKYFQTLDLQLLKGRLLTEEDIAGGRRVVVVNRALVIAYFGNEDPIGRQIKFNDFDQIPQLPHDAYFEIVGVVSDFRNDGIEQPIKPEAISPYTFSGFDDRSLAVRTVSNPGAFVNTIQQIIAGADPNIMLLEPATLDEMLQKYTFVKPKFRLISFGTCAAIGLGLALIGLFGVMAYSVALQTHELGVRMALGAQTGNILRMVLRKGLLLVGSGVAIGLLGSFLSVRVLKSQLWGISAFDVWTFVIAPLALLAVGLLACYLPARRATRVDPLIALRYE